MHDEHLVPVFGYFGQLALYNAAGLGLPSRLTAYIDPIIVHQYEIAKIFRWARERWIAHIFELKAKNHGQVSYQEMYDFWVDEVNLEVTSNNPYALKPHMVQSALQVGVMIVNRGGPENCIVLESKVARRPVIANIRKSVVNYIQTMNEPQKISRMTLWNLAIAMCGLEDGIFDYRPWLSTLIDKPVMDLNHPLINQIMRNCEYLGPMLRGRIASFECPIKTDIEGFPLNGRLDLYLDNGTIIDVKCPTSKEPRVNQRDWIQLGLYTAMMDRYKNFKLNNEIVILNLSHGVFNKAYIKSPLDDLLKNSAQVLRDRGYEPELKDSAMSDVLKGS